MEEKTNNDNELDKVERQIIRGNLFNHTIISEHVDRISEIEGFLYGMIDVLLKKGITVPEELKQAVEDVKKDMMANHDHARTGIALRVDGKEQIESPAINCNERIHICKGVCCSLRFALNAEEIEKGKIKWDLGIPYYIRHEKNGCCTHKNEGGGCSVYNDRPKVCVEYTCEHDDRIWTDFEKMELNTEWIKENLSPTAPKFYTQYGEILMHDPEEIVNKIDPGTDKQTNKS